MTRVTGGGDVMGGDDSFAAAKARWVTAVLGVSNVPVSCCLCTGLHASGISWWRQQIQSRFLSLGISWSTCRECLYKQHRTVPTSSSHSCMCCREAAYNAKRAQREAAKREGLAQKLSQAQAEEEAKMAQFRALLAKGPISIPKRQ